MNIVIPDPIVIPETYLEALDKLNVRTYETLPKDAYELVERVKEAEVITANYIDITADIIDKLPKLKYIIIPAVGFEWVDVAHARTKGISVLNCPTHNSQAVAEHGLALLFALNRKIINAVSFLRDASWGYADFLGSEVKGKEMLLVGHGNIGSRVEKMALGLGIKTSYVDSKTTEDKIDEMIRETDILFVCAPLNNKTRSLVNKSRIDSMKKSAVLINVGRGATIDQDALLAALKEKKIRGAGLDVFDDEPLTGKPNEKIVELASLDTVVATPHIAYYTEETKDRLGAELLANLKSCISGNPINRVN